MIITKSSNLNDTSFGKIEAPVKQYLVDADTAAKSNAQMESIFPVVESTNFAEAYAGQTSVNNFSPNGEAGRYPDNEFQDDYDKIVKNDVTWKNQFTISLEMIEDGKFGAIKDEATKLVDAYYNTMEEYGADFMTNAISTSHTFEGKSFNIAGGDGKALFAADHPSIVPSSRGGYKDQTNLYDAEFSYTNLAYVEAAMADQRDALGKKLNIRPDTIIVPYTTKYDADQLRLIFEALNADGNPNTADNAGNYHAGRWNVIWWNFLGSPTGMTSDKSWWMLADSKYLEKHKPFVFQKRVDLTIKTHVDENTDNNHWKGRARNRADVTNDWRGITACIPGLGTTL